MKRFRIIIFCLYSLAGCAVLQSQPDRTEIPTELSNSLSADIVQHLQNLYPPAQTQFNIVQPVPETDHFGASLVFELREKGYAVQSYDAERPEGADNGLDFSYTVDRPVSDLFKGLYRVQLRVGKTILTRAYTADNNTVNPAGAWSKLE
jgi:hypothetical protein